MNNSKQQAHWQSEVREAFEANRLRPDARAALERTLSKAACSSELRSPWRTWMSRLHKSGLGYGAAAALAASLTFAVLHFRAETTDPLDEITTFAGKPYPPDFDLEGDASVFQEIVQELVPQEAFTAEIPKQVQAHYRPADGRFFSWSGAAGVRIHLVRAGEDIASPSDKDTLYIVRLTDTSDSRFPAEKTTKKFKAQAGKEKRVKAWREGRFGYALVQYVATNDTNPAAEDTPP